VPAHARQELPMQFPNQANAKRQLFEPDNAVFQSDNVIANPSKCPHSPGASKRNRSSDLTRANAKNPISKSTCTTP